MKRDTLRTDEMKQNFGSGEIGCQIYYKEETDSTNIWAKKLAGEGVPSGTLVLADMQTAGKGRRGRSWSSPKGTSLYMTLILRPQILPQNASMLTLVMGLSVAEALRKECELDVKIKWPNDVVISGKKVCGILTEMNASIQGIDYVLIGVGINVNLKEFPEEIKKIATSLTVETGMEVSREQIAVSVLKSFEKNYQMFLETSNLAGLQEDYHRFLINSGRLVRVLALGNEWQGIAKGINDKGELLVEREDGTIEKVYAGEVSVRGIYGYV